MVPPKTYNSCYFCRKAISNRANPSLALLSDHMRGHTSEKPFKCPITFCKSSFKMRIEFIIHKLNHEKSGKDWKCAQCPSAFKTKSALKCHINCVHTTERKFKCSICPKSYKHMWELTIHTKGHDDSNRHECSQCNLRLKTRQCLTMHIKNVHGGKHYKCYFCRKLFNQDGLLAHMRSHTEEAPFKCGQAGCAAIFRNTGALYHHRRQVHLINVGPVKQFKCPHCPNTYRAKPSLAYHIGNKHPTFGSTPKFFKHCRLCGRRCKTISALHVHLRAHTGEKPYKCSKCDKDFSTSCSLKIHQKIHLQPVRDFKCRYCIKTFPSAKSVSSHERNVHIEKWARPRKCTFCPKTYPIPSALARHVVCHQVEKSFKCEQCSKEYMYIAQFKRHLKSAHNIVLPPKDKQNKKPEFICQICDKKYIHEGFLLIHQELHQDPRFPCSQCDTKLHTAALLKKHERDMHDDPQFKCYFCFKSFRIFNTLRDHVLCHTDEFPFKCSQCDKYCRRSTDLKNHVVRLHPSKDNVVQKCQQCSKTYKSTIQLNMHIFKVHKKSRTRQECRMCGIICKDIHALNQHVRTHTGEKPYVCKVCGKTFAQGSNLQAHVRRHQDRESGKRFPCEKCDKIFVTRDTLKGHLRQIHSGRGKFRCYFCPSTYTERRGLVDHMTKMHTMEWIVSCKECPSLRFLGRAELSWHRLKFHPDLCDKCPHCEKLCKTKWELTSHLVMHVQR